MLVQPFDSATNDVGSIQFRSKWLFSFCDFLGRKLFSTKKESFATPEAHKKERERLNKIYHTISKCIKLSSSKNLFTMQNMRAYNIMEWYIVCWEHTVLLLCINVETRERKRESVCVYVVDHVRNGNDFSLNEACVYVSESPKSVWSTKCIFVNLNVYKRW